MFILVLGYYFLSDMTESQTTWLYVCNSSTYHVCEKAQAFLNQMTRPEQCVLMVHWSAWICKHIQSLLASVVVGPYYIRENGSCFVFVTVLCMLLKVEHVLPAWLQRAASVWKSESDFCETKHIFFWLIIHVGPVCKPLHWDYFEG